MNEEQKINKPHISTSLSYLDIELAIAKYYNTRQHIIVPNCYINFGTSADHECDLIIIKRSGYAEEIEMKLLYDKHVAELKNLTIHDVSNRRELLIAFVDWYKTTDFNCEGCCGSDCVDEYLKSN